MFDNIDAVADMEEEEGREVGEDGEEGEGEDEDEENGEGDDE